MSEDGDNAPASQASMDAMFDKLVKMVGDLGKRMDGEISSVHQEASLISASVKNVQTQLLDKQGRFDTHKLRFPKYDGSDDPVTWLHKRGAVLPRLQYAGTSQGSDGVLLSRRRRQPVVLPLGEESGRSILDAVHRWHQPALWAAAP